MWGIGCGAAGGVHRLWWGGFRMHRPLVWKACETAVVCFGVGSAVAWCVDRSVKTMRLLQFIQYSRAPRTHPGCASGALQVHVPPALHAEAPPAFAARRAAARDSSKAARPAALAVTALTTRPPRPFCSRRTTRDAGGTSATARAGASSDRSSPLGSAPDGRRGESGRGMYICGERERQRASEGGGAVEAPHGRVVGRVARRRTGWAGRERTASRRVT